MTEVKQQRRLSNLSDHLTTEKESTVPKSGEGVFDVNKPDIRDLLAI